VVTTIPGGAFLLSRKLYYSDVWLRPPLYTRAWLWILGQASHADHEGNGHKYRRGELVTTYHTIRNALAYYDNKRLVLPSLKQIRVILDWLRSEGMISVQPIRRNQINEWRFTGAEVGAKVGADTRAYIGLRIVVENYDTYQDIESYKGRHQGRDFSEIGHVLNKEEEREKKEPPDFSSLKARYPDQDLIGRALSAIASTRKSGKVADSVLLAQLQKWERYSVGQVEAGLQTYLEKDYAGQGKREDYLLGIIRRQNPEPPSKPESTGSSLLDAYYAGRGGEAHA